MRWRRSLGCGVCRGPAHRLRRVRFARRAAVQASSEAVGGGGIPDAWPGRQGRRGRCRAIGGELSRLKGVEAGTRSVRRLGGEHAGRTRARRPPQLFGIASTCVERGGVLRPRTRRQGLDTITAAGGGRDGLRCPPGRSPRLPGLVAERAPNSRTDCWCTTLTVAPGGCGRARRRATAHHRRDPTHLSDRTARGATRLIPRARHRGEGGPERISAAATSRGLIVAERRPRHARVAGRKPPPARIGTAEGERVDLRCRIGS